MKLSAHFVDTCRRCFERWRQQVWPEVLFGVTMVLFSLACFAWVAWEWSRPHRDPELLLAGTFFLLTGLWFCYEGLRSCYLHGKDFARMVKQLPAEREWPLDFAALSTRLRESAARGAAGRWQEGVDYVCWEQANGVALYAHERGDGQFVLLFRCGGGQVLGLGRLKNWCGNEGVKFPVRFKRMNADGCVFYKNGRASIYPADRVHTFETKVLPLLEPTASHTAP